MSGTWQDEVNAAQRRVEAAEAEHAAAMEARNDLFVRLHREGVAHAKAMAEAAATEANPKGLDRTWVQRLVTPPKSSTSRT